jgi:hypothetical protein
MRQTEKRRAVSHRLTQMKHGQGRIQGTENAIPCFICVSSVSIRG